MPCNTSATEVYFTCVVKRCASKKFHSCYHSRKNLRSVLLTTGRDFAQYAESVWIAARDTEDRDEMFERASQWLPGGQSADARFERSACWTRAATNRWLDVARERLRRRFSLGRNCIWGLSTLSLRATCFVKHHSITRNEFLVARDIRGPVLMSPGGRRPSGTTVGDLVEVRTPPPFLLHA